MTPLGWLGRKTSTQTNKVTGGCLWEAGIFEKNDKTITDFKAQIGDGVWGGGGGGGY